MYRVSRSYLCSVFLWGSQKQWEFGLERVLNFPANRSQSERDFLFRTLAGCPQDPVRIRKYVFLLHKVFPNFWFLQLQISDSISRVSFKMGGEYELNLNTKRILVDYLSVGSLDYAARRGASLYHADQAPTIFLHATWTTSEYE